MENTKEFMFYEKNCFMVTYSIIRVGFGRSNCNSRKNRRYTSEGKLGRKLLMERLLLLVLLGIQEA